MKTLCTCIIALLLTSHALASDKQAKLKDTDLIANGYHKMSGDEIREKLLEKELKVIDLDAHSEYKATLSASGSRKARQIKEAHPKTLTDSRFQGRAPVLSGPVEFKINGDKIISTDGIRTYASVLYKKDDDILGVRDVDNGRVNFKIKLVSPSK